VKENKRKRQHSSSTSTDKSLRKSGSNGNNMDGDYYCAVWEGYCTAETVRNVTGYSESAVRNGCMQTVQQLR
jgi:hypothetical protein